MSELRIDPLTRVEGLGKLYIKTKNGGVERVRLEIFEPPRFFEKLLVGKKPDQVLDIVARICGLCPVAYQLTALEAFEGIFGVEVPEHISSLRRILYCGEWVSSHTAHVFFMHLPDFFGKESFLELAKKRRDILELGLELRKVGNWLIELLGGRHIHPVNLKVGGFYKLPSERQIETVLSELERAIPLSYEAVELVCSFEFPELELNSELISLGGSDTYPIMEGGIVSSEGWSVSKESFEETFEEYQEPHSTALYSRIKGKGFYTVGAIARVWNNFDKLPKSLRYKVEGILPTRNPYRSIVARAVEVAYALEEARRILERVYMKEEPFVPWEPKEGVGVGVTEAPRGVLYHRYVTDREGKVVEANIVPPTSQNQGAMEEALYPALCNAGTDHLREEAEKLIRSFDPCISCASHFLEIRAL